MLSEYGPIVKSVDPGHYMYDVTCTVSEDDVNVYLLKELLTAVRERKILRFTVWEPEGNQKKPDYSRLEQDLSR